MLCVRDVILPLAKLAGTGHRGQMSAEPMSGSNPDEVDGEGAAFAKRRQLPIRKSQMASRGMEERKTNGGKNASEKKQKGVS